jgi:hypothetical protein
MNCSNWGEIVKEGIKFCPYCGKKVNIDRLIIKEIDKRKNNRSPLVGLTEKELLLPKKRSNKNPILAAFLSFIIPGAGQIYEQEIRKGIIYFIISIVVPTMALVLLYENKNIYIAIFAFLILIAYLIFNIYIIVEAYRIAKLTTIQS